MLLIIAAGKPVSARPIPISDQHTLMQPSSKFSGVNNGPKYSPAKKGMPLLINRLPVAFTLHFDISRLTGNTAYSNPPIQDVTNIYTLVPHLMTAEHNHEHLNLFGDGHRFRS